MKLDDIQPGSKEDGDCDTPSDKMPSWMDMERFQRGQKFFQKHVMALTLAMHCSLVAGFGIVSLLTALVFTNQSDTPTKALKRYLATFYHLFLWHTEDVWDPNGRAHRSTQLVRRMHSTTGRKMTQEKGNGENVFISQYDMAIVQTGFFGAIVTYPDGFGLKCTRQELEDYVFFWRGIGYLLGIDDKYNVCKGGLDEAISFSQQVENEVLIPSLKNPAEDFDKMSNAYIDGINIPPGNEPHSRASILAFILDGMGRPGPHLGFWDTVRFWLLKLTVFLIRWCPGYEQYMNRWTLKTFEKSYKAEVNANANIILT